MNVYDQYITDTVALYHGDAVEVARRLPDNSIDYILYSPPFASLYTYSDSERDMGNVRGYEEFFQQYGYLSKELYRILRPGRLLSMHCMRLPTSKQCDGFIGQRDFRGGLIRHHEADGLILHSEVVIWKDPVTAMQRTKAIGLLYKQLRKDSALSRQGIPDYLVTMLKPGVNTKPIRHTPDEFPLARWQQYASPVWMDIHQGDTLQRESAREQEDERHIAPLQLEVIRRGLDLWSAPGDIVMDPYAGIGSTGVVAMEMGRRFVGSELKRSYYQQAVANITTACKQQTLF